MIRELGDAIRRTKRHPLWTSHPQNRTLSYPRGDIERLLRHRHPMLLLDRLTGLNLEIPSALGRRAIREEDPFLAGHFPGMPIYPGALQVEIIGQLCLCLLHFITRGRDHIVESDRPLETRALKIHNALFIEPVLPGMELEIQVRGLGLDSLTATFAGQLVHQGSILSLAFLEVYIADE